MVNTQTDSIRKHYEPVEGNSDLVSRITRMLDQIHEPVTTKHLTSLDQFHVKGLAATKELAELAGVQRHMKVLDAGSGLGGPSRYLAETFDCQVIGIDLTPSYVALAQTLAARTNLSDRVTYQVGNLLSLPFPDALFDLVWTQHVVMNISDRDQLYRELVRVLKPGGKLAFHDLYAADAKPDLLFPVPWAETQANSFLLTKAETLAALSRAGFHHGVWTDDTEQSIAALAAQNQAGPPSPESLHLMAVVGARIAGMAANIGRNAREGRLQAAFGVFEASASPSQEA